MTRHVYPPRVSTARNAFRLTACVVGASGDSSSFCAKACKANAPTATAIKSRKSLLLQSRQLDLTPKTAEASCAPLAGKIGTGCLCPTIALVNMLSTAGVFSHGMTTIILQYGHPAVRFDPL